DPRHVPVRGQAARRVEVPMGLLQGARHHPRRGGIPSPRSRQLSAHQRLIGTRAINSPAGARQIGPALRRRKTMSRKHWLAAYGEKIPCEINPDAHPSGLAMLEAAMQRFAEKPAFRSFGHMLTYADADRLSRNFAAFLQNKLGVKKGDRIAVMLPNIAAFPLAMLGIIRAGGVQVNVNPLYTPRELEHQLNDAGVETIVIFNGGSPTLAEIIGKTAVKQVISVAPGEGIGAELPAPPGDARLKTVTALPDALAQVSELPFAPIPLNGDDLLFLQYTGALRGSRRAPPSPTAISSPTPSSSKRSWEMRCAPARRWWSRRCPSITSSR